MLWFTNLFIRSLFEFLSQVVSPQLVFLREPLVAQPRVFNLVASLLILELLG